jgi:hypothetical protein
MSRPKTSQFVRHQNSNLHLPKHTYISDAGNVCGASKLKTKFALSSYFRTWITALWHSPAFGTTERLPHTISIPKLYSDRRPEHRQRRKLSKIATGRRSCRRFQSRCPTNRKQTIIVGLLKWKGYVDLG